MIASLPALNSVSTTCAIDRTFLFLVLHTDSLYTVYSNRSTMVSIRIISAPVQCAEVVQGYMIGFLVRVEVLFQYSK